jgi:hypothetical protein
MRRAIALLNKMTLEKFDKLSAAFVDVGFTTEVCVATIVHCTPTVYYILVLQCLTKQQHARRL